jgi:hypothetical protein
MAYNYANLQATARRLIAKFGNDAVLTRTATNGSQSTLNTKLCTPAQVSHMLANSGIAIGDNVCLFDYQNAPVEGDRVAWGTDNGVVMGPVVPLRVNGVSTMYFTAPVRTG